MKLVWISGDLSNSPNGIRGLKHLGTCNMEGSAVRRFLWLKSFNKSREDQLFETLEKLKEDRLFSF